MEKINLTEELEKLSSSVSLEELQDALDNLKKKKINRKNQYKEGQLVAYMPTDFNGNIYKIEIGKIKRLCDDGAFVWYHTGDTAAKTDYNDLYRIDNEYAIYNLGGQNE